MKIAHRYIAITLGMVLAALVISTTASAQCAATQPLPPGVTMQKESWRGDGLFDRRALRLTSEHDDAKQEAIVGFWRVVLTAKGNGGIPDGTVLDKGFSQWHADGTEILNSSRAPVTSNFCLGVWKKVGPGRYALNHFAISWDNYNNFAGLANIREEVGISRDGSFYSGSFTIDQYDVSGNNPLHLKGVVTGQRIEVDMAVKDLI